MPRKRSKKKKNTGKLIMIGAAALGIGALAWWWSKTSKTTAQVPLSTPISPTTGQQQLPVAQIQQQLYEEVTPVPVPTPVPAPVTGQTQTTEAPPDRAFVRINPGNNWSPSEVMIAAGGQIMLQNFDRSAHQVLIRSGDQQVGAYVVGTGISNMLVIPFPSPGEFYVSEGGYGVKVRVV